MLNRAGLCCVKRIELGGKVFTIINRNPLPYNNGSYWWNTIEVVYKNRIIMQIAAPLRKDLCRTFKRVLLVLSIMKTWDGIIRMDIDLDGSVGIIYGETINIEIEATLDS